MIIGALPQAAFQEEEALKRAARLHQVKHVFLYALNPDHLLIRWDEAYAVHPLDDAFTSSMKVQCPCWCACIHGKEARALHARDSARHTASLAAHAPPARCLRDADIACAAELRVRSYLRSPPQYGRRLICY